MLFWGEYEKSQPVVKQALKVMDLLKASPTIRIKYIPTF